MSRMNTFLLCIDIERLSMLKFISQSHTIFEIKLFHYFHFNSNMMNRRILFKCRWVCYSCAVCLWCCVRVLLIQKSYMLCILHLTEGLWWNFALECGWKSSPIRHNSMFFGLHSYGRSYLFIPLKGLAVMRVGSAGVGL